MLLAKTGGGSAGKLYVDDVFVSYLRTGTGADVTVTTGIDMTKGYMLWSKGRSGATDHAVYDSARGVTYDLVTNSTAAQTTQTTGLKSVSSTGHTVGSLAKMNTSSATYVDWVFRNADRFFTHSTISHTNGTPTNIALSSLGTVGKVIAKIANTTGDWIVWHRSLTAGNNLRLNTMAAQTTTDAWLSVSGTTATLSASAPTGTYVIYAWAHDTAADGIIQCGSFTTDGSGNATVNLGWEPQYVLYKANSAGNSWVVRDNMRGWDSSALIQLNPNISAAEGNAAGDYGTPTATGFNVKSIGASITYIYLAIRRPNKPPTSGTEVYNAIARTGTGAAATITAGFPVDLVVDSSRTDASGSFGNFVDRLRGNVARLTSISTNAEQSMSGWDAINGFDSNTGIRVGADANGLINSNFAAGWANWFFRRAPGFFDQICYNGTGANKTEAHNLTVQPELWLFKRRNSTGSWVWGSTLLLSTEKIVMPSPNGRVTDATAWNSTYPTASNVSLGTLADVNASGGTFTGYLWASLAGISKVFTYTGNGTSQTIDCGFSAGARFVMIIRVTASTAQDIFVWDSARGIIAGNDPRLSLNTAAAEVTNLDTIDPAASGFVVNQDASNVNVNGATYIGLAIA